ncbi:MAG TPA: phosphate signaling complex protein PhoU [Terriglobia bacterium]|nr:phosphate signaling complex protein PhoU [Terriglobia bacterium]
MARHLENELRHVEERFLEMGALVQRAVHTSVEALRSLDQDAAMDVLDRLEPEINRLHAEIDRLGLDLLTLQQPFATDLRFVMAIMKNNNDLERMGDRAASIALRVISMLAQPAPGSNIDVAGMSDAMEGMIRDAMEAFVRRDEHLAREVLARDDAVDRRRDAIFSSVIAEIQRRPELLQRGIDLILVSRNFERIADHATNIAENVLFLVLGKDNQRCAGTLEP